MRLLWVYILLLHTAYHVRSADEVDTLFQSINIYRTSQNLSALLQNNNAQCLAKKLAGDMKDKPCTNSSGADTVPGTEPQFPNFPSLLSDCHLNASITRDGKIMPACVPNLEADLVLGNYTKSQYAVYLNDNQFAGMGIGADKNWIVVIFATNTSEGSFVDSVSSSADSLLVSFSLVCLFLFGLFDALLPLH